MTCEDFIAQWQDENPCVEVRTSGSTGTPKCLRAEKKRMEASARTTCSFLDLRPGDRALLCLSPDYIAGKMMIARALTCGLQLTCVPPSGHPLADIDDANFGLAAMVPLQVYDTLSVPAEREKLMQIKNLIIGGGMLDDALARELRDFPNAVWCTYGMTETLSHIALRRVSGEGASEWYEPFDKVTISLDSEGCIVIDAPEVCAQRLITNDIGEMHSDGRRFKVLGRKDNVICSGGLKLQIEEIERRLAGRISAPYLITKRPDPKFGEIAVMLLESDDPEAALAAARDALPKAWQPRACVCVSSLPRTATGKPARAEAIAIASAAR